VFARHCSDVLTIADEFSNFYQTADNICGFLDIKNHLNHLSSSFVCKY